MFKHSILGENLMSDTGHTNAGENDLKTWIAAHIARRLETAGLTQTDAAERMGLKQPDLSAVLHGRLNGYSVERLARCLSALGDEVRLTVKGADGSEDAFVLKDA
ncbi:MAG: helix-turn-helix transcriptional regulator [Pseudomonadota bacterium]